MKLLTKEEQDAHYRQVVKGGALGTFLGFAGGLAGVMAASRRFHTVRSLTLPMKAFLVTSSSTFVGIIAADHSSRAFEVARNQNMQYLSQREAQHHRDESAGLSTKDRAFEFLHEEKYKIIGVTWMASIVGSFVLVGRNPFLTGQQKLVQARVYAQGLTVALMCATAAFEIHGQRQGKGIMDAGKKQQQQHHERYEGEDLWKDMVSAEEDKLKKKHKDLYRHKEEDDEKEGDKEEDEEEEDEEEKGDDKKKDEKKKDDKEKGDETKGGEKKSDEKKSDEKKGDEKKGEEKNGSNKK